MIHELRIYHCAPGRMPALLKRFNDHTLGFWERHGIRQVGFWTVEFGDSNADLYYILEWESLAERETKWNAFTPAAAATSTILATSDLDREELLRRDTC
jgi:hypothetical protein